MKTMNLYSEIKKIKEELKPEYFEVNDNYKVYYRKFMPTNPEKLILCIHGLGGHSGGFIELGKKLLSSNIGIYAIDVRGHGLSQERNQKFFYFSQILEDVKQILKIITKRHPEKPLYLLGESLGAVIALNIALEYQNHTVEIKGIHDNPKISGLILIAPGIEPKFNFNALEIIKFFLKIPINLVFKNLKLINMEDNWENANNNPEQIKIMKQDPLLLRRLSIAFLISIAKYHKKIMKDCINLELPILILQGKDDNVVSYEGAIKFYERLKSENKEIKLFENASHGLMADKATPVVIACIGDWLRKQNGKL